MVSGSSSMLLFQLTHSCTYPLNKLFYKPYYTTYQIDQHSLYHGHVLLIRKLQFTIFVVLFTYIGANAHSLTFDWLI